MQRRKFIQQAGLLAGGIVVAGWNTASAFSVSDKKIKGTVKSGKKALANVVVSDGYSVVATSNAGKFEFDLHADAVAVFVSTPAGYAFPQQNGIARHYKLVSEINTRKGIEFDLEKLSQNDDEHQFIIWADPQVKTKKDVAKMMANSVPDVQKFVQAQGSNALIHGITVGDIVWDNHELFADYNEAVGAMGIPFFQVIGNHDMDYNKGWDDQSDDTFQKMYGPTYYSFNRGKAHYVVMDDVRYLGKDREYDGYISQQQLDWLEKDLQFVPKDHLVILNVHIPVHNDVKNNLDLYAILKGRGNVHIMSGHTHYHRNVIIGNVFEHNHGTVCGAWWTGPICGDGTPCGYGVYKVKGNELTWTYKPTGMEDDYQYSVFVNDVSATEKEVVINVWNYDPEWKVNTRLPDNTVIKAEKFKGFDPLAVATLKGPDLPKPRGFAEPNKTDHLFRLQVPANLKEITVEVTDRWKRVYKSTVPIA
ncbi:metallophosphoesterase [Pseudoflavitalea sp. G-6-1-2]|uniref:calcineurin-like phosphoesterase C-terminal domain-containing protein n=1 Tax=Pseudoflavitalea sp. G-6-1-2 TaxID=2728841 RepID=UPI00146A3668|nr:calcineurin-like phosphoesterase family protein [Pseudoflavitalea sp. G-6-1-2]NML21893.1 metallophosphoesterase [Pseudoflavitalea sp. G-6-1-2]